MTTPKRASDGSDKQPRLEIFQAIWAMQELPSAGRPWGPQEAVGRICEAGFSGAFP